MWFGLFCAWAGPSLPSRPVPPLKVVAPAVPEAVRPLRALLLAYHPEDLPGPEALSSNGGATALRWLATQDDLLVVRRRALNSLRHFPGPVTAELCTTVAHSKQHATVRSAAVGCIEAAGDLTPLLTDPDIRVRRSAELAHALITP